MINVPTTLILGAGASVPYGFPAGQPLLYAISENLQRKQSMLHRVLLSIFGDRSQLVSFGEQLRESHQPSVDAFLTSPSRADLRGIGKAAIACSLLTLEDPGTLQRVNDEKSAGRWYSLLFKDFGNSVEDFFGTQKNLSIITFNYDRSLEHYIYSAFKNYHNSEDDLIKVFVEGLPVLHLYGSLGKPAIWYPGEIPYRSDYDESTLLNLTRRASSSIEILGDEEKSTNQFERAAELIAGSKIVCFLGFGYHQSNMERLFINLDSLGNIELFGSAYGLGDSISERVTRFFEDRYGKRITLGLENQDAYEFLRQNYVLRT